MTPREHRIRMHVTYEGDANTVASRAVQRFVDEEWMTWQVGNDTAGFLIYTYALFKCQELFFRMNCAERQLALEHADGELYVYSEDFHIQRVTCRFEGRLRSGTPSEDDIAWIQKRMRVCPVSRNLGDHVERVAEAVLGPTRTSS